MGHETVIQAEAILQRAAVVFWDFDGVIKDSVVAKSVALEQLFLPYGRDLANRVRQHHETHGGVSRYKKMPIYLDWAGETGTAAQIEEFCDRFARLVRQSVIDSAWVPGVREYLQDRHARQHFVLVTATPQAEMLQILDALGIAHCFREVHGFPTPKAEAIREVLPRLQCSPEQALVVGDSEADFDAATVNNVPFLLRRTPLSSDLQRRYHGLYFDNLKFSDGLR